LHPPGTWIQAIKIIISQTRAILQLVHSYHACRDQKATAEVEDLDLTSKSEEEHIQLALSTIAKQEFRPSGKPYLSLREAAKAYSVSRMTLTATSMAGPFVPKLMSMSRNLALGVKKR